MTQEQTPSLPRSERRRLTRESLTCKACKAALSGAIRSSRAYCDDRCRQWAHRRPLEVPPWSASFQDNPDWAKQWILARYRSAGRDMPNAGPSRNDSAPSEPYDTLRPKLIRQLAAIEVEHQQKAYPGARFCPTMFEAAIAEALYQTMYIQKQSSDRLAAFMNPSDEPQVPTKRSRRRAT